VILKVLEPIIEGEGTGGGWEFGEGGPGEDLG